MIWRMAWRNLWRNPRRTFLTVTIIALGLSLLMLLLSYLEGMSDTMRDQLARSSIGHVQVHHPQYRAQRQVNMLTPDAARTVQMIEALPGVIGVRPRLSVSAAIRSSKSSTVRVVPLAGVDRDQEIGVSAEPRQVVEGDYVVPPPEATAPDAPLRFRRRRGITLGDKLAELLQVRLGSKVRLDMPCLSSATCSGAWIVTGIVDSGSDSQDQNIALVDLEGLQDVLGTGDQVHEISVVLEHGRDPAATVAAIQQRLADVHVPLRPLDFSWVDRLAGVAADEEPVASLAVEAWWDLNPNLQAMLTMIDTASGFSYVLMLILMSAGILTTMFTVVYERRREVGVQAALGTSPGRILLGAAAETVWLGLLGILVGTLLGGTWAWLMTTVGIDISGMAGNVNAGGFYFDSVLRGRMTVRVFTEPATIVFVSTILFGIFPAIRMARLKPVDAMADKG